MTEELRPSPIVEKMGPPISRVLWSPDFASQAVEILPVALDRGALVWLKPIHAPALRVGLPKAADPSAAVVATLARYPLEPIVVHSTSWRADGDRIVLTYLAAVHSPQELVADSLVAIPVGRTDLARVDAHARIDSIRVDQVLEHALRHAAWLVKEDPVVGAALVHWRGLLDAYNPEPFRSLR